MNKFTLAILLLFISHLVSAQTGYKQNLTDFSSITFPQQPIRIDTLGQKAYRYVDSLAIYLAIVKESTEDDVVFDTAELPKYYEGVVKGILEATNGKLISKKAFQIDSLNGVDLVYISTVNPDLPDLRFQRIIFINGAVITINLLTSSEHKAVAENMSSKFFNSFAINPSATALTQGTENAFALKIGSLVGKVSVWVLIFVVVIGVPVGIVFLVRRFSAKPN